MGYWADQFGRRSEALSHLNQAVADYETLTRRFPNDLKLWIALARCHRDTGQHLAANSTTRMLWLRHGRRAIAILERLARDNPTAISIQAEWAAALCNDANLPPPGRELSDYWTRDLELCIRILREVVAADPNLPEPLADLGLALWNYGNALHGRGRREEGLTSLKEARSAPARRDFSEPGFRYIDGYYHRLQTEVNLAYSLAAKGRPAEALDLIRQGSAICNAASHYREAVFWEEVLVDEFTEFTATPPLQPGELTRRPKPRIEPKPSMRKSSNPLARDLGPRGDAFDLVHGGAPRTGSCSAPGLP